MFTRTDGTPINPNSYTEVNINNYTYKRIDDDNEIISKFTNYTNTTTQ
ncbi:MAG: hypothetical protein IKP29_06025 [Pseudobutyrivibrio sp.]|nr:hypothetical protein [Pseudobutyrivibrio sp.]